ncbi:MAG: dihydropteroate synthase [Candidatus Omnitrophota bacterium]
MIDTGFSERTYIMGVLNITPDSFSGDGIYKKIGHALEKGELLVKEGADIIDVGGESTRPGSKAVSLEEEIERVIPVIEGLKKKVDVPISIDTKKSEVARLALEKGASIVNDITGLEGDSDMARIVASFGAKVVIMHIKGEPSTMQLDPMYDNLIEEIIAKLQELSDRAQASGIKKENIIIDPGIGFGKTLEHNLEILNGLSRFKVLGYPVMVGVSRKSFIGHILEKSPEDRIFGTASSIAIAINNGADIIRVHDVREMAEVAKVADAILKSGEKINAG